MQIGNFNSKSRLKLRNNNPIESFLMDNDNQLSYEFLNNQIENLKQKKQPPQRKEFTIFNYNHYYEQELVKKQIKELSERIRQEIVLLRKASDSIQSEIKDIESITINTVSEKPGVYHIRFLEIILRILKTLREKISDSKTWLSALITRKKKRGSLFLSLSKKKGTQYSLSQELQVARSTQ